MRLSELAGQFQKSSYSLVAIRARQYLQLSGSWASERNEGSHIARRGGQCYRVATEIQAVACHDLKYHGKQDGLIWLSYHDPKPQQRFPDLQNPMRLRSVIWTSEEAVAAAWLALCDSWVGAPLWLRPKPVVFCRQYEVDGDYTDIGLTDVVFLRQLDFMRTFLDQHKSYHDRRLTRIAQETKQKGPYQQILHQHDDRQSLISTISHRLNKFIDGQFNALADETGVKQVKPIEPPSPGE